MNRYFYCIILGAAAILILSTNASNGGVNKYVEDFTTTQYKDTLKTTALWDTTAGDLKLRPFELRLVGSHNTNGPCALGVAISGDCAYVVDEDSLLVINISDPENPSWRGGCDPDGTPRGVAISGNYAYVAIGNGGLQVIDITNPGNPSIVKTCPLGSGHAYAVAISGDYAYVAHLSALKVVDISDPPNAALVTAFGTTSARDVAVSGNYAYVADDGSLLAVDIGDPTNPTPAGAFPTPGNAYSVAISGDYAYVADNTAGLAVIDISNPDTLEFVVSCTPPYKAYDVAISGDLAYVADYDYGIQVVDITDPTNPQPSKNCSTPDNAYSVAVSGDYAYVADGTSGLQVVDVADERDPLIYIGGHDTPGTAFSVTVDGDRAFVADGSSGLRVIEISDPASPTEAGYYNTPGTAYDVAIEGDYAYVADYSEGLRIIDVGDPTDPTEVGSYVNGRRECSGIAISGNSAYLSDYYDGLLRFNITNPSVPSYTATYTYTGNPPAYRVAVSGDYAYVAYGPARLVKVDISTGLSFVGNCPQVFDARDVFVSWYYAFVADGAWGLRVVDVRSMTSVGNYDTPGTAHGVAVSGDYAFVADGSSGLHVIDITNPANPTLLRSYDALVDARDVSISGDYAIVADGSSGIEVIKVFERELSIGPNEAWSLALDNSDETIASVKVTTSQSDSIRWELSADGGSNWQEVQPDDNVHTMANPGSDLLWRSTHIQPPPYTGNPTCTFLEIDWFLEAAVIDSIRDIPNDQGRQVRVRWARSGYDFLGSALPITEYAIYRKIDYNLAMASDFTRLAKGSLGKRITPVDRDYAHLYPPGDWDFLLTVPADCEEEYAAVVPTLKDSTIAKGMYYTTFFVRARTATPGVYFDSVPDSGYSVDNLAPSVPEGFAVAYNTGSGNQLGWDPCPDEDFQYFCVYRSNDPEFVPTPSDLVYTTVSTNWNDPEYDGWNVYYKVSACDFAGNESDAASAGTMTAVSEPVIPKTYALYPSVPNPFNPMTTIRYDVPTGGGKVTLRIFDVRGQLVRTLVESVQTPGEKQVIWYGRDDRGNGVATGVYFYRMTAPGFEMTHKMILLQ